MVYGALSPADLQKAVEKEFEMALQDRIMEETKDRKNAVEAYVYDMRNKVCHIALAVSDGQFLCPIRIIICESDPFLSLSFSAVQLNDKYQEFVTPPDKDQFIARLQEVEDWLYEEGEDETKSVYVAKLEELKKVRIVVPCVLFLFLPYFSPLSS